MNNMHAVNERQPYYCVEKQSGHVFNTCEFKQYLKHFQCVLYYVTPKHLVLMLQTSHLLMKHSQFELHVQSMIANHDTFLSF